MIYPARVIYSRISDLSAGKFQQLKLKMWRRLHVSIIFLLWRKIPKLIFRCGAKYIFNFYILAQITYALKCTYWWRKLHVIKLAQNTISQQCNINEIFCVPIDPFYRFSVPGDCKFRPK